DLVTGVQTCALPICDIGDGAHLRGEVRGELVDVVGQVAPRAGGAGDVRAPSQLPFHPHFAGHGGDLIGEGGEGIDHVVDGVAELGDLAARLDGQLLFEDAIGHRGDHLGDAA